MNVSPDVKRFTFPEKVEIRYTRTELAEEVKNTVKEKYNLTANYVGDAHTLSLTVNNYAELKAFLGSI